MAGVQLRQVLRHVRALAGADDASDRRLLEHFAGAHEEEAFAEVVRRHGPLVWGVCRRVLHHQQDAEDVFQATFLVLARRAGSVRWGESVAGWLHETARRTALKARAASQRRQQRERQAHAMRQATETTASEVELREALDAELGRMPACYREALLLCGVEGLTNEEAARRLGCPVGTVKSRLARGRDLLRAGLGRRGVALSAAGLAAAVAGHATAAPPAAVAATAVRAAVGFALGAATNVPRATALANAVLRSTAVGPVKALTGLVLALAVLAAGVGALARQGAPAAPADPPQRPEARQAVAEEPALPNDPLPAGALVRLGTARFRPGATVYSVAFSPDGQRLATGSYGEAVRVWDIVTGKEVEKLRMTDHRWRTCVAFSPDGKWLATGDSGGTFFLRDKDGAKVFASSSGSSVRCLAFARDGKTAAAALQDGSIRLCSLPDRVHDDVCRGHTGDVWSVAFSPDGKTLASAGADGSVRLWDCVRAAELHRLTGHSGEVKCVAYSPDGKFVASAGSDKTVRLWDVASGKELKKFEGHTDKVEAVVFSADGKSLFSGGYDNTLRRWNVGTGKEIVEARRHQRGVMCLALSADGKTLASGGWDGIARLWSVADGKELNRTGGHQDGVVAAAMLPGRRKLATVGSDQTLRLWDAASGQELKRFGGHDASSWTAAFSADGKTAALRKDARTVARRAADTGQELNTFTVSRGRVGCLALSWDGRLVAAGIADPPAITLWDAVTGKELCRCEGHPGAPRCLDISPDGKRIASGGHDNLVIVWDAATGKELLRLEGHQKPLERVAFSPDGRRLATGANEGVVRLWDAATGKELRQLPGHDDGAHTLAFSADGRTLAAAGFSPVIRLWEVGTGQSRGRLAGHNGAVTALAFTPDGRDLISGGADTTALVWDLTNGRRKPAALTDPELEALWADLAGEDAVKAYHAVWALAGAPGQALPLLRAALKPVPAVEAVRLRRLVAELDDDDFEVRERATRALEEAGEQAEAELRKALEGKPSAEVRQRAGALLARLRPDAASPERRRSERALEALEAMGTPEAGKLMELLAGGAAGARLTREAKAALERMRRRNAAAGD